MSGSRDPLPETPPPETADQRKDRLKKEEQDRQKERLAWAMHQSNNFATFKREGWTASDDDPEKYKNSGDRSDPNFLGAFVAEGDTFFEKGKIYDHNTITAQNGFGILYDENGFVRAVPPIHELSKYGIRGIVTHPEEFKKAIDAEIDFISGALGFDTIKADYPAVNETTKTHFLKKFELTLESCRERGLRFKMDENGPFMQSLPKEERLKLQEAIMEVNKHAEAMELQRASTNDKLYDRDARAINSVGEHIDPANTEQYRDKAYQDKNNGAEAKLADIADVDADKKIELADKKLKVIDEELQKLDQFIDKVSNANDTLKSELVSKAALLAEPEDAVGKRVQYLESSERKAKYDKMSDTQKNLNKISTKENIIENVEKANNIIDGKRKVMIHQIDGKLKKLEGMRDVWQKELADLKPQLEALKTKQKADHLAEQDPAKKQQIEDKIKKLEDQIKQVETLDKKAGDAQKKLEGQKAQLEKSKKDTSEMLQAIKDAKEKQADLKVKVKNN